MTTFTSLNELGLIANTNYTNTNMTIVTVDGDSYKINRTANKIVFVETAEGDIKRVTLKKIASTNGSSEGSVTKTKKVIEHIDLGFGILSNTDYKDSGIVIIHKNLGEMTLVKTSAKMLFVLDNENTLKRARVDMMIGLGSNNAFNNVPSDDAIEMEEELKTHEQTLDPFFDNDNDNDVICD